jgi:hypothetical protein
MTELYSSGGYGVQQLFRAGAIMTEHEYFLNLEMRVTRELAGMRQKELTSLWCDGFIPAQFAIVGQRCRITGDVWLAFGQERQELWRFVVNLGRAVPRETINWAAMLPEEDVTGWLMLDFETKFMKISPHTAHHDGDSAETKPVRDSAQT